MKKPKQQYSVYALVHQDYGDGHINESCTYVGTTWAVSEAQAVNNFCYRNGLYNGSIQEWYGDGHQQTFYRARTSDQPVDNYVYDSVFGEWPPVDVWDDAQ